MKSPKISSNKMLLKIVVIIIICFRNNAISPMTQLLLTLRFFATGSFLITAGDFGGVSIAAAGQIVKRVSYALASISDK